MRKQFRTLCLSLLAFAALAHCSTAQTSDNKNILKMVQKAAKSPSYRQYKKLLSIAQKNNNETIRLYAVRAIRKLRTLRALFPLQKIMKKDPSLAVKTEAGFALSELPRYKGYRFLEYAASLDSYKQKVRFAAIRVLVVKRGRHIKFMMNLLLRDKNYPIRLEAAKHLKQTVAKENIAYMNRLLLKGETTKIKYLIAEAMLILKNRRTLRPAIAAYKRAKDEKLKKLLFKLINSIDSKSAKKLKK